MAGVCVPFSLRIDTYCFADFGISCINPGISYKKPFDVWLRESRDITLQSRSRKSMIITI